MQLGGLAGMTALTMGLGPERANGHKEPTDEKIPEIPDSTRTESL
jgi:hypothetical protein